jgi:hypothetical protein
LTANAVVPDLGPDEIANEPPERRHDDPARPMSDRALAIVVGILVIALVLGYLLLNKLADMSQEEDCALGNRYNCGALVAPGR